MCAVCMYSSSFDLFDLIVYYMLPLLFGLCLNVCVLIACVLLILLLFHCCVYCLRVLFFVDVFKC